MLLFILNLPLLLLVTACEIILSLAISALLLGYKELPKID